MGAPAWARPLEPKTARGKAFCQQAVSKPARTVPNLRQTRSKTRLGAIGRSPRSEQILKPPLKPDPFAPEKYAIAATDYYARPTGTRRSLCRLGRQCALARRPLRLARRRTPPVRRLRRLPLVFARHLGGLAWSDVDLVRGYLRLSAASLVTTFILTQRSGACQRIANSDNRAAQAVGCRRWPTARFCHDRHFASHHQPPPPGRTSAQSPRDRRRLCAGRYSPWVTGARAADVVVLGATLPDRREVLLPSTPVCQASVLRAAATGRTVASSTAKSACRASWSRTIRFWPVRWKTSCRPQRGGTGGLQTSTLAVGLATAASTFWRPNPKSVPTWPARRRTATRRTDAHRQPARFGQWRGGLFQRGTAHARQQPGPAGHAIGARRRQRFRLRRRSPGRPLVPRGLVLFGLELSPSRFERESL